MVSFCCFLYYANWGAYVASEQGADEENAQALKTADGERWRGMRGRTSYAQIRSSSQARSSRSSVMVLTKQ